MIDVVVGVEGGQRQPGKHRRETVVAQRLPEHPAPLNVVVTIEIATANRISRNLQTPEYEADYDCSGAHLSAASRILELRRIPKL